jgi:hypothetical protein
MKPDMSPEAVTRRLRRVAELVRVCHALAGPRRRKRPGAVTQGSSQVTRLPGESSS